MNLWRCQHLVTAPGPADALPGWGEEPQREVSGSLGWWLLPMESKGPQVPELWGWIQAFLFPPKLHFWRCPEETLWTRARRESCPALQLHLPWRDVWTQHRLLRGKGLHLWGWLSLSWTKSQAGAGRVLCWAGGRTPSPLTVFCLWAVSLCFFVAQTGAQPLPFHMKHTGVAELACHIACSHELGCAPRLAQAHLCCCTLVPDTHRGVFLVWKMFCLRESSSSLLSYYNHICDFSSEQPFLMRKVW